MIVRHLSVMASVAALAATTGGVAAASTDNAAPRAAAFPASTKLLPKSGAYLGAYYGDQSLSATNAQLGTNPALHLTYFGWNDAWGTSKIVKDDLAAGRIPLVNWEPYRAGTETAVDFKKIADGTYDTMIRARAKEAKALGKPFFLDVAAEMNGIQDFGKQGPAVYKAAYRHMHDIFVKEGATNAVWVWAPNNRDGEGGTTGIEFYPGADVVDWVGIDGYNWGTYPPDFEWESFEEVFGPMYDKLSALGKPILIAETASDEKGGSKAQWITDIVPTLKSRFPAIKGVVWFDVKKERDWRLHSSTATFAAFKKIANDPYFAANNAKGGRR